MKAKITTITMKLGDREIVLTEEEAKALREQLNTLFGNPATTIFQTFPERPNREHITAPSWLPKDIICRSQPHRLVPTLGR